MTNYCKSLCFYFGTFLAVALINNGNLPIINVTEPRIGPSVFGHSMLTH